MDQGTFRYPPMDSVIYGKPFAQALAAEAQRLGANAVYVLAGRTLSRETDVLQQARDALGNKLAGVCTEIGAHTPRTDVVAAANAARAAGADLLATIGGGSVTDAAKMVGLCLGNDITRPQQLDALPRRDTARRHHPPAADVAARTCARSPCRSRSPAGEFTAFAGCTDTVRQVKESYAHPLMMPRTVILDPAIAAHTPLWLFLSTGIRAVDHAVEDICSTNSQPFSDGTSLHALRLLGRGLRATKADPASLEARLDCQLGAWMSIVGSQNNVQKGASHGIGHVLGGTAGVPHGYTSCVMLPHVLRYNATVNAERQQWVSEALGHPDRPAADVVASLIAELGLPGRLRDVDVKADMLDRIAEGSMHDRWVHTNPRRIDGPATVRMLLDAAW